MTNLFRTINPIHARTTLVLALGGFALLNGHPVAACETDPGRYEAMVGAPAPRLSDPATDCDGRIAFGAGDGRCGSLSGGPSGGDDSRN